ncbi:UNKNOWN [Stylonychia lemnae]|uniref:Uncharacterized protein n=1 Tax=Stylonychia lemnae TaxID=5949 RepID=A0A078A3D2_STYLE|nr:UNKNOWN [Stylonychia lemnae]|eukprot:CDW76682.1 UNKNOWN [Stylonychia lemnae]
MLMLSAAVSMLIAVTSALNGNLPYYNWNEEIFRNDVANAVIKLKAYNGWRTTHANDHDSVTCGLEVVSEARFSLEAELFNSYKYTSYVRIRPIQWMPVQFDLNYQFYNDFNLVLVAKTWAQFGVITSWIYQNNKAYTGSIIDPILDSSKKFDDVQHGYVEPPFYEKYEEQSEGKQTGYWNWAPMSNEGFTKTYFSWTIWQ